MVSRSRRLRMSIRSASRAETIRSMPGLRRAQCVEGRGRDRQGATRLERGYGRRTPVVRTQQRELPEVVAGRQDREGGCGTGRETAVDCQVAVLHQVQ